MKLGLTLQTSSVASVLDSFPVQSNLLFRYESDYGVTTVSDGVNDRVDSWADQSPNGFHMTASSTTKRPVLTPNKLNGYPGVFFSAVSGYVLRSTTMTFPSNPTNYTFFFVYQSSVNADGLAAFLFDIQSGRLVMYHAGNATTPTSSGYSHGTSAQLITRLPDNTDQLITYRLRTSGGCSIRRNGENLTTSLGYNTRAVGGTVAMGARYTLDQSYLGGWMYGAYGYSTYLSDADVAKVEQYALNKFGIV